MRGVAGIMRDSIVDDFFGRFDFAKLKKYITQVAAGKFVIWVQFERLPEMLGGIFRFALYLGYRPQHVMGVGDCWVDGKRGLQTAFGICVVLLLLQDKTQVAVGFGVVRI